MHFALIYRSVRSRNQNNAMSEQQRPRINFQLNAFRDRVDLFGWKNQIQRHTGTERHRAARNCICLKLCYLVSDRNTERERAPASKRANCIYIFFRFVDSVYVQTFGSKLAANLVNFLHSQIVLGPHPHICHPTKKAAEGKIDDIRVVPFRRIS